MAKIKYQDTVINVAGDVTEEQARTALSQAYPELGNAEPKTSFDPETGEKIVTFEVQSGNKGADGQTIVIYAGERVSLPAGTDVAAAKTAMQLAYPELGNAADPVVTHEGADTIMEFKVESGNKGDK